MHDSGRWHFYLHLRRAQAGIRRCNSEWLYGSAQQLGSVQIPSALPKFPAGWGREGQAPWCNIARVFQRGHHSIGPAGEAVACCQCINPLQKLLAASSPASASCGRMIVIVVRELENRDHWPRGKNAAWRMQLLRPPLFQHGSTSAAGQQQDEARQQNRRPRSPLVRGLISRDYLYIYHYYNMSGIKNTMSITHVSV